MVKSYPSPQPFLSLCVSPVVKKFLIGFFRTILFRVVFQKRGILIVTINSLLSPVIEFFQEIGVIFVEFGKTLPLNFLTRGYLKNKDYKKCFILKKIINYLRFFQILLLPFEGVDQLDLEETLEGCL